MVHLETVDQSPGGLPRLEFEPLSAVSSVEAAPGTLRDPAVITEESLETDALIPPPRLR